MQAKIHYQIVPADPGGHIFEVHCHIAEPDADGQRLSLPAWTPGSYLVRDFAGHVIELEASCGGDETGVSKADKSSWQCAPCKGPLLVHYRVYAKDLSVRGAHLDSTRGFFNGPCIFLRVHGQENQRCTVHMERHGHDRFSGWRLATSMRRLDAEPHGFGLYEAADYDELIDHPVETGEFETQYFEAHGVPHQLVVSGRHHSDLARVARDLKAVCEYQMELFGLPAPIDRYVFLLTVLGSGYGGLEHRWSCAMMASRGDLPAYGSDEVTDAYRGFLGLASHEYFHLWNVRRIRPAPVAESDLSREAYTRQLWIFEGITSYYDDLSLLRAGVISSDSYLDLVSNMATRVWSGRGRFTQSLADASFDAWVKFYKRDHNAPNTQVSYYTKGALAALGLDLTIRERTADACSLDDVMRAVWQQYGLTDTPLPEGRFEQLCTEVCGTDLGDYFDSVIYGVTDPPLDELLARLGVTFTMLPLPDGQNRPPVKPPTGNVPALHIGFANDNGKLMVTTVFQHGPAHRAGLASGDELLALEGVRVTPDNYQQLLSRYRPRDLVRIDVFRRDELLRFTAELDPAPPAAVRVAIDSDAGSASVEIRRLWMQGKTH